MRYFGIPRFAAGCLLYCALIGVGCNEPNSRPVVKGTVMYQGKPVGNKTLTLHFKNEVGEFFTRKIPINPDGAFQADAPNPGIYKVLIEESRAAQEGRGEPGVPVPARYLRAETTDLTWNIDRGENVRDFVLTD